MVRVEFKTSVKGSEIKMNDVMFNELLWKQDFLDKIITANHGLQRESLLTDKIIALEVELSEFANEIRFFKFWSNKGMNREKALTEYVDGLHFFLSIANDLDIDFNMSDDINDNDYSVRICYARCKKRVIDLMTANDVKRVWHMAFSWFWSMGKKVGFSEKEIYKEYEHKYRINIARQENGY